jgi:hypothetical protein
VDCDHSTNDATVKLCGGVGVKLLVSNARPETPMLVGESLSWVIKSLPYLGKHLPLLRLESPHKAPPDAVS